MRGKIFLSALFIALTAVLFVSCRTLPPGEAEVSATVEIEVEIVNTDTQPEKAAPQSQAQVVPEPAPEVQPEARQQEDPAPAPEAEPGPEPEADLPSEAEPAPEPVPAPVPAPVPQPEPESTNYKTGMTGPHGGILFKTGYGYLETGVASETIPYEYAAPYCEYQAENPKEFRVPTIGELSELYSQLIETGLYYPGFDYAWSSNVNDDGTVKVMNLITGFIGSFYPDVIKLVGVIPVTPVI